MAAADKRALKREAKREIAAVEEILRRWDPIHIAPGEFAPADEYDSYAPRLVSMVREGCTLEDLCRRLETIRVQVIGVEADAAQDRAVAAQVLDALRGE